MQPVDACTKKYVDAVAQGIEFINSNLFRHPDSFGENGQAYLCVSENCTYIKVDGNWEYFSGKRNLIYMWCPTCHKKYRDSIKHDFCSFCGESLVELDITDERFEKLDEYCTKGDIVEAALGAAS